MKKEQIDLPYCNIYFKDNFFTVEPTDSDTWIGRFPSSPKGRSTTVKKDEIGKGKALLAKKIMTELKQNLKAIQKEIKKLEKFIK